MKDMIKEDIIKQLQSRWVSREELSVYLGVNDTEVRSWVRNLNEELSRNNSCVISTASKRGYHIPDLTKEEDRSLVDHAIAELRAKAISILERAELLETTARNSKYQQLSLF